MPEKYTDERTSPKYPVCGRSHIHLMFNGKVLEAAGAVGGISFPAASGKPDEKGNFDYSPQRQTVPYKGPIPEGEYWIQPSQLWENNWIKSVIRTPRSAWGNYRITIHPYPTTQTHGRGGFFIHGGNTAGSAGCIDLTVHMDKFVERLKKELGGLPECFIPLTVSYANR